jgi:hypothetical protein
MRPGFCRVRVARFVSGSNLGLGTGAVKRDKAAHCLGLETEPLGSHGDVPGICGRARSESAFARRAQTPPSHVPAVPTETGSGSAAGSRHLRVRHRIELAPISAGTRRDRQTSTPSRATTATSSIRPGELQHRLRARGLTDAEIAEVVAHVALNVFTNYFNLTSGTEVDLPAVPALEVVG